MDIHLATIDVKDALVNPDAAAIKMRQAMEDVGFLYLVNIPGFHVTANFLLFPHYLIFSCALSARNSVRGHPVVLQFTAKRQNDRCQKLFPSDE